MALRWNEVRADMPIENERIHVVGLVRSRVGHPRRPVINLNRKTVKVDVPDPDGGKPRQLAWKMRSCAACPGFVPEPLTSRGGRRR